MRYVALALVGMSLMVNGCKKSGGTPEAAFLNFSKWVMLGQLDAMEKYGEKQYVTQLYQSYDSLAMLSETWPKNPIVISSTINGNEAELKVEGQAITGKATVGTFKVRKTGEDWLVYEGYWHSLLGEQPVTSSGE